MSPHRFFLYRPRFFGSPAALLFLASAGLLRAVAADQAETNRVSFAREIAPIFFRKCQACHGPEKAKGDFRLHTYQEMRRGGESRKPPVTPGDPAKSHLYELITTPDADDRMPQKDDPLSAEQIELVRRWIEQGANFDGPDEALPLSQIIPQPPHPSPPEIYHRAVPLRALAFDPGNGGLAVGGYHEVVVWNLEGPALSRRITNMPERLYALVWLTNRSLLVCAGGAPGRAGEIRTVGLPDGPNDQLGLTFADMILAMAANPAGSKLVSAGADNTIRVFDLASRKQEKLIEQHSDWVMAVAVSHDGSKIVSASRDKTARVFDSQTGEMQTSYLGHAAPLYAALFSADDKTVFTAGADQKIHSWSVQDGKKLGESEGLDGDIYQLLAVGDQVFSGGADKRLRQHRADSLKSVTQYGAASDEICGLAFDAAGKRLAAGTFSGEVLLWQEGKPQPVADFIALPGLAAKTNSRAGGGSAP